MNNRNDTPVDYDKEFGADIEVVHNLPTEERKRIETAIWGDPPEHPVAVEAQFPDTPPEPGETTAADAEAIGALYDDNEVMDMIDPHGVVRAKQSVDVAALRAAAEAANQEKWRYFDREVFAEHIGEVCTTGGPMDTEANPNGRYIALANPSTVLAILDERDRAVEDARVARMLLYDSTEGRAVLYTHILREWSEDERRSFGLMLLRRSEEQEAARDRAIRALRRMVDDCVTSVNVLRSDRVIWSCSSRQCTVNHGYSTMQADSREAIPHRPGCPVPDAEVVLREAGESAVQ